ncbi:MAG TPA: TonB-dependent receptor [Blastocatellia bacterium]|nr:TonB-dependent receptor [Blastocatellia bacterium]
MAARTIFLVALLSFSTLVHAQSGAHPSPPPAGEIRLEVKDPSGKVIEASGRLESLTTGISTDFQTDVRGQYTFERVAFGRYRLEVSKDGFAAYSAVINVRSNEPLARTVTLSLSSLAFKMDVVATTPLPGVDLEPDDIPAPVQAATRRDIEMSGANDLSDFMNRRLSGVHVNEMQGNPFQPDVNYRGYTASPLLGTPQGLSVYMDGVRLNQPFGDVVSWDLIPRLAIAEVALMPGSNPLFGLNTLGGSLSIQTKDGRSQHGTSIQLGGGSFGRATADFEHGGHNSNGLNWYLGSSLFFEDGWREDSPSNVRQFFGKLGRQRGKTTLGLTVAYANNLLTGNGLQEQRFLDRDYAGVYTKPDLTGNRSPFINLMARHSVTPHLTLSGNLYYRYIRTNTFNGDLNEDSLDQSVYQPTAAERAALAAAGYRGFPIAGATAANTPFPFWRCLGQVLLGDEPAERCNGLLNRTGSQQRNYGLSGQATWFSSLRGHRHQLTVGAAYDGNSVGFGQSSQLGCLNPDRSITGVNAFGDGVTGGEVDGEPYDTRVDLHGRIQTGSVFATDTLSIGNGWTFTLSGRYNRTTIDNTDRIRPDGEPGSLNGHHVFGRFNPAVGLTYSPGRGLNAYASYTEGSRAPTSIELGCADPTQPCKLPNALAGDPPLDQVVTRTVEAGLRGGVEGKMNWNVGWFRADNRQDLLFVASNQTGFGYFKNFGKTRRQGLKLDVNGQLGRLSLGSSYTYLQATFQSPESVDGSSNSTNDAEAPGLEGTIRIAPGSQIPLIPRHIFKSYADLRAARNFTVNLGLVALSSSYARGNENNRHQPDGFYYLGSGRSLGYAVANLGARYQITRRVQLMAQINNLFNRRYYTAAQLGPTGFTENGNFIARPFAAADGEFPVQHATFYAPGAPRGAWGGIRISL